ncbi:MAG: hypothetical protein NT031_11045 [Planctomycetota bacterium]|nr:hypothetical protein [Planctomycetota bacterium]
MIESQSTAPNLPRHRNLVTKILLGLSSCGVLIQLFYFVVDYHFAEPLRSQIKRVVDANFLLYAAVVFPSILIFYVCVIVLGMRWVQRSAQARPSRHRVLRSVAYVACWILLFAPAAWIGGVAPICWYVIESSGPIRTPACVVAAVFTAIAVGSEFLCRRQRLWLRPLVWGALAGSIAQLIYLWSVGWHIEVAL